MHLLWFLIIVLNRSSEAVLATASAGPTAMSLSGKRFRIAFLTLSGSSVGLRVRCRISLVASSIAPSNVHAGPSASNQRNGLPSISTNSPADDLHSSSVAFWTAKIAFLQGKKQIAIPAPQLPGNMRIGNLGARGKCIFTEETEVKIHRIFHYTGVIADDKLNADDSAGIGVLSVFKRQRQKRFDNALFMHLGHRLTVSAGACK